MVPAVAAGGPAATAGSGPASPNPRLRATALLGGPTTEEIPVADSLARACAGVPVVVEGLMRHAGFHDEVVEAFHSEVGRLAGPDAAARLRQLGMERLHDVCTLDQIAALKYALQERLRPLAVPVVRALVPVIGPGFGNRYFVDLRVGVRNMVPVATLAGVPAEQRQGGGGGLGPYIKHSDTVVTIPRRAVSLWVALGRVTSGNTVLLWPRPGGDPVTPAMAAGDVLCFATDDSHATVENRTDETRVSIGFRVVPGRLLHFGPGDRWRPYADARLLDTPLRRWAALQSWWTPANARRLRRRVGAALASRPSRRSGPAGTEVGS